MSEECKNKESVKTLKCYIEKVRCIRIKKWGVPEHQELWFRGERCKYKTWLQPPLYRYQPSKSVPDLLDDERKMFEKFKAVGGQLSNEKFGADQEDLAWYRLMQHHGAPNRILHWTDGALIALHFAIWKSGSSEKCNDCNPRVYVLNPVSYRKICSSSEPDIQRYLPNCIYNSPEDSSHEPCMLLDSQRISRRDVAQRSRSMIFGKNGTWLSDRLDTGNIIKEITIDLEYVNSLKVELRNSGITQSVIKPDLDGLGEELTGIFERWKIRTS